jgi:hypothetical protein
MARKKNFSRRARNKRMSIFTDLMGIKGGENIIDLGGSPTFWEACPIPLKITIINLPGSVPPVPEQSIHEMLFVEGDACNVEMYGDASFDIAFSNSVIEHVGDQEKQAQMAAEVHRLAPRYWVQTPSIWFPIEAHNNMPFWWFWPKWMQNIAIHRWRRTLPAWCEMVETTRVLLIEDLNKMFPNSELYVERWMGFTKSYTLYRK